ncbi:uncharacterized protein TRIADDRAFT_61988 [Trichoplax adhaerens]|uniref:Glucosidase 2 subunit beta-like domain-containing protein n=1 Tax=Trichoplax adhaerens TaxID=10228 RepID=B3SCJ0_TRIAD|nr:hypothetical protein TRIADDRAFT_61988 [Trichoplax adhaerens]EDV19544.1 hypothetical protein TRIADDRAFT_61988 [Trichoplax adhaerens]|eukprot:XP_002117976.1 hypothetical protein TRIADDRAFT_61988 [Trichoplax adhaerens]
MDEGDDCGEHHRFSKVYIKCGEINKLVSVNEPETCCYAVIFETPLICYNDAMLVYPYLSHSLQSRLDRLDVQVLSAEVTEKGREKWRNDIFVEAGFILDVESTVLRSVSDNLPSIDKEPNEDSEKLVNSIPEDDKRKDVLANNEEKQDGLSCCTEIEKLRKVVYVLADKEWLKMCKNDSDCLYNKTMHLSSLDNDKT